MTCPPDVVAADAPRFALLPVATLVGLRVVDGDNPSYPNRAAEFLLKKAMGKSYFYTFRHPLKTHKLKCQFLFVYFILFLSLQRAADEYPPCGIRRVC